MPPLLSRLPLVEDVLLTIVLMCDIPSILSLSQTSRYHHDLAFTKEIWRPIVAELHARCFLDLLPGQSLADLTTEDLVDLVRRAVRGPRRWAPSRLGQVIEPSQRIWQRVGAAANLIQSHILHTRKFRPVVESPKQGVLHEVILDRDNGLSPDAECELQLLPGGQYLLFRQKCRLECWSLVDKCVVWHYQRESSDPSELSARFAYEMVSAGQAVLIFVLSMSTRNFTSVAEVLRLDLMTRTPLTLLFQEYESLSITPPLCGICGDFAIINDQDTIRLFQISTGSCRIFMQDVYRRHRVDLVPEHLIATSYRISDHSMDILIFNLHELSNSRNNQRIPIHNMGVPCVYSTHINLKTKSFYQCLDSLISFSLHWSPLRADAFRIWLIFQMRDRRGNELNHLPIYKVDRALDDFGTPLKDFDLSPMTYITDVEPIEPWDTSRGCDISYSGHFPIRDSTRKEKPWIFSVRASGNVARIRDLPRCVESADVARYSGALTFFTEENIVVRYYT